MKSIRYSVSAWHLFSLGILVLALSAPFSQTFAVSPDNLIVVYNTDMPESKAVARHYAKKRQVPVSNLVGVDVPTTERMTRTDFEAGLIPPVKAALEKCIAQGQKPSLLLVYGIPLLVKGPADTAADEALLALAREKVREYQGLVRDLTDRLDRLLSENTSQNDPTTSPDPNRNETQDVLKMGEDAVKRGLHSLTDMKSAAPRQATAAGIASILIRLAGTATAVKAALAGAPKDKEAYVEFLRSQELLKWHALLETELVQQSFRGVRPEWALEASTRVRFLQGVMGELKFWDDVKTAYADGKTSASVDSELTLILAGPHQMARWVPNPFHEGYDRLPFIGNIREKTILVGRLDAPTPKLARRMVDDAVATERRGLEGVFYIDARGLATTGNYGSYAWYERHLVNLYDILKEETDLEVVIDRKPDLFPPGACPDAALYCGWYSLRNYVDAFTWKKGAVGFHVASAEASTLRAVDSNVWCKRMLENGVAATLGPVAEPYLLSFPLPDRFFPLLLSGEHPLLEVYFRTLPSLSWRQVLIGDPLYTPFKKNPAIRLPLKRKPSIPLKEENTEDPGAERF